MKPHRPETLSKKKKKLQPLRSNPPQKPKSATAHLKIPLNKQNHNRPTNDYSNRTLNHQRPLIKISQISPNPNKPKEKTRILLSQYQKHKRNDSKITEKIKRHFLG
jgi:hypothetical protein